MPTSVQIMVIWRQATSHSLGQCWRRSISSCGVTRPHWVNACNPWALFGEGVKRFLQAHKLFGFAYLPWDVSVLYTGPRDLHFPQRITCRSVSGCSVGLSSGGRVTTRSREVSKPRDSGSYFCHSSKFDRHLGSSAAEMPVKFRSDAVIITSNLAASILHEIWR